VEALTPAQQKALAIEVSEFMGKLNRQGKLAGLLDSGMK